MRDLTTEKYIFVLSIGVTVSHIEWVKGTWSLYLSWTLAKLNLKS